MKTRIKLLKIAAYVSITVGLMCFGLFLVEGNWLTAPWALAVGVWAFNALDAVTHPTTRE